MPTGHEVDAMRAIWGGESFWQIRVARPAEAAGDAHGRDVCKRSDVEVYDHRLSPIIMPRSSAC
jgi:hypothetical protein